MRIKISSDSICDLSQEIIQQRDIGILALSVILGDRDALDGISIVAQDIYDYYNEHKKLPKTGARSSEEYATYYQSVLDQGYDALVHFTISDSMSSSFSSAKIAANDFENVYVIDSRNLSTGTGLLVMYASDLAMQGLDAKTIADKVNERASKVKASFILDNLEFLHKGGRCTSLAYLGANVLGIKPVIEVRNGTMGVAKKFIGRFGRCIDKYCAHIRELCTNPDKTRCFVTHTKMDDGIVEKVVETVKSWGIFDEVIETTAGCTVTTHCGANTIGILFIND